MRNCRLGCNCDRPKRLGAGDDPGEDTPMDYDEYYNQASATVENLWNDVEGAGVWAKNEFNSLNNFASLPFQETANEGTDIYNTAQGNNSPPQSVVGQLPGAIAQGAENLGSDIGNLFSSGFNDVLLIGGAAIILLALLKDK